MKSPKQNGKWGHFSLRVQKEKMKAFENDIVRDEFDELESNKAKAVNPAHKFVRRSGHVKRDNKKKKNIQNSFLLL